MNGLSPVALRLAAVVAEAWFAVCETPKPAAAATAEQTASFRAMALAGLASARAGRRGEADVAKVMCEAFWTSCGQSRAWGAHSRLQREVFLRVASALIAAGQALAAERDALGDHGLRLPAGPVGEAGGLAPSAQGGS